jgi:DNA-directed RNA polymerase subunit RPC12/RpoP
MMWSSIQCPRCVSHRIARERGQWEWIWFIAAAASFFMRWLLMFARYGEYRGEPGLYRCANCGRTFTFFV